MPKEQLKVGDLRRAHKLYLNNINEWRFLLAAYDGARELIRLGYLEKHERESLKNYERRMKEAFGFSYSKSVVDLFNFYLFKKPVYRDMANMKEDKLWLLFMEDCNLYGDPWDDFLTEVDRYASICGFMGLLVDKADTEFETKGQQLEAEVYPYVAAYFPTAILDWDYDRDEHNRPFLSYIKLLDEDGQYRLWWTDHYEVWEVPGMDEDEADTDIEDVRTKAEVDDEQQAKFIKEGVNPLKEIPFVWLWNIKSKKRPIGVSDIHDVARIDVSILRNLSQGEEVINWGAFPMMRKPMKEAKPGVPSPKKEDEVGEQAVLEFDPEHPDSKPDWLESSVGEPITSILEWIARKVAEIYRAVNAGGMASMEVSTVAKSGAALKAEFQLLNASLVRKAVNLEKAEREVIGYWTGWEERKEDAKKIEIERARTYDVEDLAADLENILTSMVIVKSKKFSIAMQKQTARLMMPAAEDKQLEEIDEDIETFVEEPPPDEDDMMFEDEEEIEEGKETVPE